MKQCADYMVCRHHRRLGFSQRQSCTGSWSHARAAQYSAEFIKRNIRSQQELPVSVCRSAIAFPACVGVGVLRISWRQRMRTQRRRRRRRRVALLNARLGECAGRPVVGRRR